SARSSVRAARRALGEPAPAGEPDPARLATIIEDVVSPLAFRMALPRASTDRIKQALAMLGRLSHRPDGKTNSRRLAFRDAFGTALDIFELSAMATGVGQDLVRDWRGLQTRIQRARETGEIPAPPPPVRRKRRRGGRGRGRRAAAP